MQPQFAPSTYATFLYNTESARLTLAVSSALILLRFPQGCQPIAQLRELRV